MTEKESHNEGGTPVLNNKVLSFVISIVTLLTLLFGMVTMWNNYTYKIDQLEIRNAELLTEVNKLNAKIDKLNEKLVSLTIALNRIDDRTKSAQ